MWSGKKLITITISVIVLISNLTFADWKEDARAIKVSGGEHHTLVLTKNKFAWGCGDNSHYQLGTGDTDDRWALVRVQDGDMNIPSGYLENINDVDAGYWHSLGLDVNGFVWAWGNNQSGQLGDNQDSGSESSTPVQVPEPGTFLFLVLGAVALRGRKHFLN